VQFFECGPAFRRIATGQHDTYSPLRELAADLETNTAVAARHYRDLPGHQYPLRWAGG
jgi:hypothetical protein